MGGCCAKKAKTKALSQAKIDELTGKTHFTKEELNQWYSHFMNEYPGGSMSSEEFTAAYKQMLPPDAAAFGQFVFRVFDANRDGVIDFEEFIIALSLMQAGSLEDKVRVTFSIYDQDGNGDISKEEMLSIFEAIHSVAPVDPDNPLPDPVTKRDKVFKIMDTNEDGVVSVEEFVTAVKKYPEIIKPLPF